MGGGRWGEGDGGNEMGGVRWGEGDGGNEMGGVKKREPVLSCQLFDHRLL